MTKAQTFTVTLPDGTTAKRTSKTMTYAYAILVGPTEGQAAVERFAQSLERSAERDEQCTTRNDAYYRSKCADQYESTYAILMANMRERVAEQRARAAQCREQGQMIGATWGVLGWSQRHDSAMAKSRSREARYWAEDGWTVRVVPVN